jgi:hypothetical protein
MVAGGVADGEALELGDGFAAEAGAAISVVIVVSEKDSRAAEVTTRGRLAVFLEAGTIEKVHGSAP